MDVAALRAAIATACTSIPGLTCLPYLPDSVAPPTLYVQPESVTYDLAYGRALDEIMLSIHVVVSSVDDLSSQQLLDAYLAGSGTYSIRTALEAARGAPAQPAFGGLADDFHVSGVATYAKQVIGTDLYVGAELTIRVIGHG